MVTINEKAEFSDRLNKALDKVGYPAKGAGRQVKLAKEFSVSQKGARKWVEGEAIPSTERLTEIAKRLNINVEWLLSGRGSMTPGVVEGKVQTYLDPPHLSLTAHGVMEVNTYTLPDEMRQHVDALIRLWAAGKLSERRMRLLVEMASPDEIEEAREG